ncbi:hypothetical protein BleG1_1344 [Shouchella lehensis G1]|uniref:Uncharacterized protein n=1 Tax=Shouchella lehensis G1 TaxID=1246626 RepID=A0A060LUT9_9BACI|nr:hypothetical protein BleG1_1344 [Shouchella lehensis G1]
MSPESEGFSCSDATQHILDYSSFQILLLVMSQPLSFVYNRPYFPNWRVNVVKHSIFEIPLFTTMKKASDYVNGIGG